jgi:hypothetical protein
MKTKQQTAVEWLIEQIENKNGKEFASYYSEFIDQAKEMEKKQMINFCQIWEDGSIEDTKTDLYNKMFGGDK